MKNVCFREFKLCHSLPRFVYIWNTSFRPSYYFLLIKLVTNFCLYTYKLFLLQIYKYLQTYLQIYINMCRHICRYMNMCRLICRYISAYVCALFLCTCTCAGHTLSTSLPFYPFNSVIKPTFISPIYIFLEIHFYHKTKI